jgi:hypothetical protein
MAVLQRVQVWRRDASSEPEVGANSSADLFNNSQID